MGGFGIATAVRARVIRGRGDGQTPFRRYMLSGRGELGPLDALPIRTGLGPLGNSGESTPIVATGRGRRAQLG